MKTTKFFLMAALALTFAACSNDDNDILNPAQTAKGEGITITATLAPKDAGATTRAVSEGTNEIVTSWAQNEGIAILYTVGSEKKRADATITNVDANGVATITFKVESGTPDNTECTLVYPKGAAKADNTGVKDYATLLAEQYGKLNTDFDVRVGAGKIQTTTPSLDVTTQPKAQFAIFKFTLDGVSIDATHPLVIKDNASNNTITTVTPDKTATSVFVAMPAAASTTYKFVVITADNKYIKSGTATIEAGKYYQTTLTMTGRYPLALSSATAEWDLGAVACSDGNLYMEKKAAPSGKTAVGIVGNVTATGHGLILALKDATEQTWNTINGWTSVNTYAGTTLKVLPNNAARGSLTSYTKLGSTNVSNWAVGQKSDYDAIFTNLGSTASDIDGTTFDGNVTAYITTGVGGDAFQTYYWCATDHNEDGGWMFTSTWFEGDYRTNTNSVRPVLGF